MMNNTSNFWIGIIILFTSISLSAQIATEAPLPSDIYTVPEAIPSYRMPAVDEAALLAEDALEDKGLPLRFGKRLPVQLNLQNAGAWVELPDGGRLWRLRIESPAAYSIGILYQHFELPQGAQLFLYNDQQDYKLGAFTTANQKIDYQFATTPVPGDALVLEYYEPAAVRGQGRIELSQVVHAYRNLFPDRKNARTFGASGACNNDVACPISAGWQDPIQSVALIIVNGNRACTGAMVNNANNDGTPYFLTAEHCMGGATAGTQLNTWSFIFNYQSPSCNGSDGNLSQSISGALVRATFADSDVSLLELSSPPPAAYGVFFAGWNSVNSPADTVCGIHHPRGDVKKITFDYDPVISTAGLSGVANSHWEISTWDNGTTEPGSSGSPLFDQNQRIIGQLHGGTASCNSLTYDAYGKFSLSWLGGGTTGTQLKYWLDPNNTGTTVLDGTYQNIQPLDLAVSSFQGIQQGSSLCDSIIQPSVTLLNQGDSVVTSFDLTYQYSGQAAQVYNWTGTLASFTSTTISLPQQTLSPGNYDLEVYLNNTNGVQDNNLSNDTLSSNFSILNGSELRFNLQTDPYANETSFQVLDDNFAVIDQVSSGFSDNTLYNYDYCLQDTGCYYFVINDSYGDGLSGFSGQNQGYASLYYQNTQVDSLWGEDFDYSDTLQFCFSSTPLAASFMLNSNSVCTNQMVNVTDNSTGAVSWQWDLPNATPASSTQANPSFSYNAPGQYSITLTVTDNQGNTATSNQVIQVNDDYLVSTTLNTDGQPADLSLQLLDEQGNIIYSDASFNQPNSTENADFCLEDGCYIFRLEDAAGNGFSNTNGSFEVFYQGQSYGLISGNYGSLDSILICVPYINSTSHVTATQIQVFPNPTNNLLTLRSPQRIQNWQLIDVLGQTLREGESQGRQLEISLSDFPQGVYLLRLKVDEQWLTKQVVKQ